MLAQVALAFDRYKSAHQSPMFFRAQPALCRRDPSHHLEHRGVRAADS
jgi:hypothetical protein